MASLLARAFGLRVNSPTDASLSGSPQTVLERRSSTNLAKELPQTLTVEQMGSMDSVDSAKLLHGVASDSSTRPSTPGTPPRTCDAENGDICKGSLLAGSLEDVHRCGNAAIPDSGGEGKNNARAEALRRAEMLARFDHSYDGRDRRQPGRRSCVF
jgi:hypothetical protein